MSKARSALCSKQPTVTILTLTLKAFCNSFQHFKRSLSVIFIFCFRNYSLSPSGPSMNLHSNGALRPCRSNNTECWVLLPSHYPTPRNSYWVAPKIWHWLHQVFFNHPPLWKFPLYKRRGSGPVHSQLLCKPHALTLRICILSSS